VTDELVEKILQPGLEPGAADVFLDFICYSGGPLPEEMLPNVKVPSWKAKFSLSEIGPIRRNNSSITWEFLLCHTVIWVLSAVKLVSLD
jgi:hypothetical protein